MPLTASLPLLPFQRILSETVSSFASKWPFFRSSQTSALTHCHASGFFLGFFELVLFFPFQFNYFLMFFWPSSWEVLCALPCLWPYPHRLWAGYKAAAHLGCWNWSLSDCKTWVRLDLLLRPGRAVNARGLNSASGFPVGGVGFPYCHCKGGNGPCLALWWVKRWGGGWGKLVPALH